eukprot:COSAG01_NODE_348_length_18498_cov_181.563128_3_plen_82_part_00
MCAAVPTWLRAECTVAGGGVADVWLAPSFGRGNQALGHASPLSSVMANAYILAEMRAMDLMMKEEMCVCARACVRACWSRH